MVAVQYSSADDLELARRAIGGDAEAFGVLFERWFDRAFDVAWHIVHNRDTAAEVTQEAFASAWQQIGNLRQPESFGGWLLRIARNKGLNRLQRERRSRPVGDEETLVTLDPRRSDDPTQALTHREHGDLVWAASAALGEEDASMLSLHLRHGLGAPELAEELGVKPNAAHQRLFRLKKRLADAIGAWVLWRHAAPSCPTLRVTLNDAGITRFDGTTATLIAAHARGCSDCDASRELRLSPEALFGAMPLVAAEPVLRAKVVAALDAMDVPARGPSTAHPPEAAVEPGEAGADTQASADEIAAAPTGEAGPSVLPSTPTDADGEPDGRSRRARRRTVAGVAAAVAFVAGGLAAGVMLVDGTADTDAETTSAAADSDIPENVGTTAPTTTGQATTTNAAANDTTDAPANDADVGTATAPPQTPSPAQPTDPDRATDGFAGSNTTAATQPAAPPVIGGFRASPGDLLCQRPHVPTTFVWSSTGATSATLGPQDGPAGSVPTDGTARRCSPAGVTWILTVTGPGGSQSAQAQAPSYPPG